MADLEPLLRCPNLFIPKSLCVQHKSPVTAHMEARLPHCKCRVRFEAGVLAGEEGVGGEEEGVWEVGAVVAHPAARALSHPHPEEAIWDTGLVKRWAGPA